MKNMINPDLIGKPCTEIWRVEDDGTMYTAKSAMEKFAGEYWEDQPRSLDGIKGNLFTVIDGTQVYRIDYRTVEQAGLWPRQYWIVSRVQE